MRQNVVLCGNGLNKVLRDAHFLHLAHRNREAGHSQNLCNCVSQDAILIFLSWGKDSTIENYTK